MLSDFQRLSGDEQKIAKLIAARLWLPVADEAAAIVATERCTKLVDVPGLTVRVCEAYHELMKTSQQEAERVLKENLLHCAAEAAFFNVVSHQYRQSSDSRGLNSSILPIRWSSAQGICGCSNAERPSPGNHPLARQPSLDLARPRR